MTRRMLQMTEKQAAACKARIGQDKVAKPAAKRPKSKPSKPQTPEKARKPTKLPRALSEAEERFAVQLRASGIEFGREVTFCLGRKWRLDFSIWGGETLLAVEIQGRGRHQSWTGFAADCEKLSHASGIYGYRLILATPQQVKSGAALAWTKAALGL